MTKEYMFGIQDYHKATWGQNFVASIAGAVASITVAAPLDTIKTRIQNANFESKVSGMTVVKDLLKNEGPGALFKGLTPKVRHRHLSRAVDKGHAADGGGLAHADLGRRPEAGVQLYACAVTHPLVLQVRIRRMSHGWLPSYPDLVMLLSPYRMLCSLRPRYATAIRAQKSILTHCRPPPLIAYLLDSYNRFLVIGIDRDLILMLETYEGCLESLNFAVIGHGGGGRGALELADMQRYCPPFPGVG